MRFLSHCMPCYLSFKISPVLIVSTAMLIPQNKLGETEDERSPGREHTYFGMHA